MDTKAQLIKYQDIISQYGALPDGGITRLLYTDEWYDALKKLQSEMEKLGFDTRFDSVGNLFGVVRGTTDEYVSTGSHIDTVVEGGNLDGQFGITAGLVAINNLVQKYGQPKKNLQLIAVAEEEGSRFPVVFWGSRNIFGIANKKEVERLVNSKGESFEEEMRRYGFDYKQNTEPEPVGKFVELHIEQGNLLEQIKKPIGVITAITGQKRYDVNIKGEANHAGTTRMDYRRDVSLAYSTIVKEAIEKAIEMDDILVVTFGRVKYIPNTVNVVPGEVDFSIDTRHPDQKVLDEFTNWLENRMKEISENLGMDISINKWMDQAPVPMDDNIIETIEQSADEMNINYETMHSGAGHDSQIFAEHVPTGMIFVPSIKGISHNINEKTDIDDLVLGVELLEKVLYKLAY